MTADRLDNLESTLAHHERQIQDLSDMVLRQGREIEALKTLLHKAQAEIEEMQSGDGPAANVRPPHY
jgi:SlyX protein